MSAAEFITSSLTPIGSSWFDQTQVAKAKEHGAACPVTPTTDEAGADNFVLLNYYDLPLSEYIAYARTGDAAFQTLARKCADAWWQQQSWIGEGKVRAWLPPPQGEDNAAPPPRHAGIAGLTLRAEDGRPELWDWINSYTRYFFDIYVMRRLNSALYDLREGAFTLHYATWLAKGLPDSFPLTAGGTATNGAQLRAQYLADVEMAAVQYFGRTQRADGAWVWNDDWLDDDGGSLVGVMQPFMVGLLLAALCDVYELTGNATVKENVKSQITRGCRHLYSDGPYIKDQIEQVSGKRIRGFHYFYHGGTSVNPTRYEKGDIAFPWTALEAWWLPGTRQAISTILPAFGKAFQLSGDPFFKTAGDELWDAAYSGSDGVRAMMDGTPKNYNQHARRVASYLAWTGAPVPAPVPVPVPPPAPLPEPSPDGTKATTIVDAARATWTIGSARQTLRDGVQAGGGEGSIYKYLAQTVYVFGTDNFWYKWAGSAWERLTQTEPGTTPAPAPEPEPQPSPTTPCTISAPASVSIRKNSTGTIAVTLQDLTGPVEVRVSGSDGQVTVSPLVWNAGPTSTIKQFSVRVKRQSRTITFQSPCGVATVWVNVV
jgi:hypothetical protein